MFCNAKVATDIPVVLGPWDLWVSMNLLPVASPYEIVPPVCRVTTDGFSGCWPVLPGPVNCPGASCGRSISQHYKDKI